MIEGEGEGEGKEKENRSHFARCFDSPARKASDRRDDGVGLGGAGDGDEEGGGDYRAWRAGAVVGREGVGRAKERNSSTIALR